MACSRCGEGGEARSSKLQKEGFGEYSNYAECEAVCPRSIGIKFIGYMNRESLKETSSAPSSLVVRCQRSEDATSRDQSTHPPP